MTPERWREIEKLFNEVAGRPREEQAAELANVEPELRREVEKLLASDGLSNPGAAKAVREAAAEVIADAMPAQVGRYRVLWKIGEGGQGVIYAAEDTQLGRKVAIKMIRESSGIMTRERLWREARAAASLNHPNVCQVYEVGEERGELFIAMEMLEGESLASRLSRGPLPPTEAIPIALAALGALGALHDRGLVHRDMKPSNIFLTPHGVKLLDFGLARPVVITGADLTETGVIIGTPAYMAPEQAAGRTANSRSDLFAMGVILYEMLSGKHPFSRSSTIDLLHAVIHDEPSALSGEALTSADRVVRRALAKRPENRYPTAEAFAADLQSLSAPSPLAARRRVAALTILGFLAVAILVAWLLLFRSYPIDSIAVLPFQNADTGQNLQYLGDGISEDLIISLARLPGVSVSSRNTVSRYKGREVDAKTIGSELQVQAVVFGRVAQQGETLVINAELVDSANGRLLWGEQYRQTLADILTAQSDIAKHISENLRPRLSGKQQQEVVKRYTDDPKAYNLYLMGRFAYEKRTTNDVEKAVEYFNQAIASDSRYAAAYVGLSQSYMTLNEFGVLPTKEAMQRAKSASLKALELDNTIDNAYATLGFIRLVFDWDRAEAEQNLNKALELNPNNATARQWHGVLLVSNGRFDEGIAETQRSVKMEPLPINQSQLARALYLSSRFDDAIVQARKTVELYPDFPSGYIFLGQSLIQKGKFSEGIQALEKATNLSNRSEPLAALGRGYAMAGRIRDALDVIEQLKAFPNRTTTYQVATVYAGLGDRQHALEWLQVAYEESDPLLALRLRVDPAFEGLHAEPRFKDLLQRLGFS